MFTHHSCFRIILLLTMISPLVSACFGKTEATSTTRNATVVACTTQDGTYFTLSGTATYDWIPAKTAAEAGAAYARLDYTSAAARPARRTIVQSVNSSGAVLSEAVTDDAGEFSIDVPGGCGAAKIRVLAKAKATANTTDGIGPNTCVGASWDVRVVDNTRSKAVWGMETTGSYSTSTSGVSVHAPTTFSGGAYTKRTGAPFAMLDTIVTEMELVCGGKPNQTFPLLYVNWSSKNIATSSVNYGLGYIITSHYTTDGNDVSNIYVLGKEGADTDEYDDHVIAHEYGHYLENEIFRSDSIGGYHSLGDVLDPRVAFGEGFGNALSGMTFNDPHYVDTNGSQQLYGFSINVSTAPSSGGTYDDRGVYSETSVQYLLYHLYNNRKASNGTTPFDRIHQILQNNQLSSFAFTTALTFAAFYNQEFGSTAENLNVLWGTQLDTPMNALCDGVCTGTGDTADPFDSDNDIGIHYSASSRFYARNDSWNAEFWRIYRRLVVGANPATGHEQIVWDSSDYPKNKYGNNRWYVFTAPASAKTEIEVSNVTGAGGSPCNTNILDMFVYRSWLPVGSDASTGGCPSVSFNATAGSTYIINIRGNPSPTEPTSWDISITQ